MTFLILLAMFWLLDGLFLWLAVAVAVGSGVDVDVILLAGLIYIVVDFFAHLLAVRVVRAMSPSPSAPTRVRIGSTEWDLYRAEGACFQHDMPDGSEVLLLRGGGQHEHAEYRGDLGRHRPGRASLRRDGRASSATMRRPR